MQSRDRVLTTLLHQEPDRVPFDLGATLVSSIKPRDLPRRPPAARPRRGPARPLLNTSRSPHWSTTTSAPASASTPAESWSAPPRRVPPESGGRHQHGTSCDWGIWRKPKATGLYYDMT